MFNINSFSCTYRKIQINQHLNWVFLKRNSYVVAVLLGYDTGFPVFHYNTVTKCHIPDDLKGRSYCRFLRPVTSSTNLKCTNTVWSVPPLPQRTPLLNSLRGAKYPEVGSRLFSAHSTTHFPVLS